MKKGIIAAVVFSLVVGLSAVAFADEAFDVVKKRGTLIVGVRDGVPGFGFVDPQTREIVGYDVDFAKYLAKKLGVKLEMKPVVPATRITSLVEGNLDIVIATMTYTAERAKQVDFSYTYFKTEQKLLVKKGTIKSLQDLEGKKIGTSKGSTSEQNAKKALPNSTILSFDDYGPAVLALEQGKVAAVTTDASILEQLHEKMPNKNRYEIPDIKISDEPYGIGIRKDSPKMLKFVNETLLEMEKNGEARKIFEKWFGPKSPLPQKRLFKITADR